MNKLSIIFLILYLSQYLKRDKFAKELARMNRIYLRVANHKFRARNQAIGTLIHDTNDVYTIGHHLLGLRKSSLIVTRGQANVSMFSR